MIVKRACNPWGSFLSMVWDFNWAFGLEVQPYLHGEPGLAGLPSWQAVRDGNGNDDSGCRKNMHQVACHRPRFAHYLLDTVSAASQRRTTGRMCWEAMHSRAQQPWPRLVYVRIYDVMTRVGCWERGSSWTTPSLTSLAACGLSLPIPCASSGPLGPQPATRPTFTWPRRWWAQALYPRALAALSSSGHCWLEAPATLPSHQPIGGTSQVFSGFCKSVAVVNQCWGNFSKGSIPLIGFTRLLFLSSHRVCRHWPPWPPCFLALVLLGWEGDLLPKDVGVAPRQGGRGTFRP